MAEGPKPGRELDARVASEVMGWKDVQVRSIANAYGQHVIDEYTGTPPDQPRAVLVPRYSSMVQDAWTVVETLRARFMFVAVISGKAPSGPPQPWICKIGKDGAFIEDRAESAALAICQSALRAVEPRS